MVPRKEFSADRVRKDYARLAWAFNLWSALTEAKAIAWLADRAAMTGGLEVLDVGTGTGMALKRLARQNLHGRNTGIDLSPHMLRRASANLKRTGCPFELVEGNAFNLPFEDGRFDRVISCFMIDLMSEEDIAKVLGELNRVMKKGGLLMTANMTFGEGRVTRIWEWITRKFPRLLTDCRPIDPIPLLEQSGFRVVEHACLVHNTMPEAVAVSRKS